ncbi:hypothetical protein HN858_02750 [Candidatus Falkowbacteria bacterium]|jgi:hypothetical protein|nr:hypothetical protein [Candidatus Falkowbacteria bacterium]MBT5503432.1 hypothetical protein [Candidatus Falkowbacteria bacterium]MBT6574005.1 hypothetical protein [Candidatus Falkowbacteria bacterium]MBT7348575.1 hypothetical protein [Candidatus Falkowbacteria bacterium]MBT7500365.1 hypothetical protein [Candidatus Falkowbacteria bacterium]
MKGGKCSYWKRANHIGLFFLVMFVLCFLWYYIRPVEQSMHLSMLRMSFFGFEGMNTLSFILGAIQAYVWGYIVSGVWVLVGCHCKDDKCKK